MDAEDLVMQERQYQSFSSHGIDQIHTEYFGFSATMVDLHNHFAPYVL